MQPDGSNLQKEPGKDISKLLTWLTEHRLALPLSLGIVLLAVGLLLARHPDQRQPFSDQPQKTQNGSFNEVTAQSVSDFRNVCNGGRITNAATYSGATPHPIAVFRQGINQDNYSQQSLPYTQHTWEADYKQFSSTQLVACLVRKREGSPTKKCEYQKVSLDFVPVVYELTVYEAQSHKKLGSKEISGPALECPSFVTYDEDERKIYGQPDMGQIVEAVRSYVMS